MSLLTLMLGSLNVGGYSTDKTNKREIGEMFPDEDVSCVGAEGDEVDR